MIDLVVAKGQGQEDVAKPARVKKIAAQGEDAAEANTPS